MTRISSRYYSSQPKLQLEPYQQHRLKSDLSAMFIVLCLGALASIAFYNLLIYASIRDKAFLYYGFYVLTYFTGWALTFHIPAHLFELHALQLHHLFFIGLPIFNILFYKHFLQLPELSPKLWQLSKYLMWACIIALPTSILFDFLHCNYCFNIDYVMDCFSDHLWQCLFAKRLLSCPLFYFRIHLFIAACSPYFARKYGDYA